MEVLYFSQCAFILLYRDCTSSSDNFLTLPVKDYVWRLWDQAQKLSKDHWKHLTGRYNIKLKTIMNCNDSLLINYYKTNNACMQRLFCPALLKQTMQDYFQVFVNPQLFCWLRHLSFLVFHCQVQAGTVIYYCCAKLLATKRDSNLAGCNETHCQISNGILTVSPVVRKLDIFWNWSLVNTILTKYRINIKL